MIYRDAAWWYSKLLIKSTYNAHPFAIVLCTCIHARMPGFYMIPCSWAPPPSGIGMVSESCWPNMMPNLHLPRRWKLNWVNWSSPWGMSKARVPPKLAALLALWCMDSGESQMTGMTWVLGNRVKHVCKGDRLMPDDLVFIWLRSQSVDNKLYKLPWFTSEVAWNASQDR